MSKKCKKPQKEVPHNLPFPNLRIDCYGKNTHVYLDGMEITPGVLEINFKAVALCRQEPPVLDLKLHPHTAFLEKVNSERVDTALVTERHQRSEKKVK